MLPSQSFPHLRVSDSTNLPQFSTLLSCWCIKVQNKLESSEESLVNVLIKVSCENDYSREVFNVVEENTNVHIGIAISGGTILRDN